MYTLKKSLGQHFLKDESVCIRIVAELKNCSFSNLVEVGPGGGALTKYLLEIPGINFKAIELDTEKVEYLQEKFPAIKSKIINKSILETDPPFTDQFALIGNFPYNISTEIVFKILDWKENVSCAIGMFQKEVAQRLAARHGSKVYGVTSVLTQAWFDIEYLFDVDETAFTPPPKVKSGVLKLTPRKDTEPMKTEADFKKLVKAAFGQRRKMMRNACAGLFDPSVLAEVIFTKRAEQLSVRDFAALSFKMK